MTVPAKLFQQWLSCVAGDTSQAAVCRAAGIKRSTLAQQLVRGRVSVATVAAVSRSLDLPVVESLSVFPKFYDLAQGLKLPTHAELLSQIPDNDLLLEFLNRRKAEETNTEPPGILLAPPYHRSSVRAWMDAIDGSDLRQKVARSMSMAPQNLSAQISANRLSAELAVESARIAGVGLANGLVANGFLAPGEAGWVPGSRTKVLQDTPDSALALLVAQRLEALSKALRRHEEDSAAVLRVWENLG
ncbi:hypothetical protein ACFUCV_05230 [Specibacter sp. NPDC057265]|uniref:hypothetical protein n=1 Tax=Specibacter sp. NPDC057265 TaxID=3346075 RepID=UPI0036311A6D